MRILGIDPGLNKTGWGIIDADQNRLHFVASGVVKTQASLPLDARLVLIDEGIGKAVNDWQPESAAIEETFVNNNPRSTLKLGMARGVALVSAARQGLMVGEYSPNLIKKSVVGTGHAAKEQIAMMVKTLLPKSGTVTEDEADALAVAICHAHHLQTSVLMNNLR